MQAERSRVKQDTHFGIARMETYVLGMRNWQRQGGSGESGFELDPVGLWLLSLSLHLGDSFKQTTAHLHVSHSEGPRWARP